MSGIAEIINADKYVTYADDSYVVITGTTLQEVKDRVKLISCKHVAELQRRGMKVNAAKTEVVIFSKKAKLREEIDIAGTIISSKSSMKALGVLFDQNLNWKEHIEHNIKSSVWKLAVLKRIRPKFTTDQFLQILTSQFFSKFYYCSQIWLTSATTGKLWTMLNSLHYRAIRIAVCDYKTRINREKLDFISSRASPKQWSKYAVANSVIKILRDKLPINLHGTLVETLYEERRKPGFGRFYDNSRGKIGKQKLGNNIQFMMAISEPWLDKDWNDDKIRRTLKKTFFPYVTVNKLF